MFKTLKKHPIFAISFSQHFSIQIHNGTEEKKE